jgi:hypothetical protein
MLQVSILPVITGCQYAYHRKDGVLVVPIGCLKNKKYYRINVSSFPGVRCFFTQVSGWLIIVHFLFFPGISISPLQLSPGSQDHTGNPQPDNHVKAINKP